MTTLKEWNKMEFCPDIFPSFLCSMGCMFFYHDYFQCSISNSTHLSFSSYEYVLHFSRNNSLLLFPLLSIYGHYQHQTLEVEPPDRRTDGSQISVANLIFFLSLFFPSSTSSIFFNCQTDGCCWSWDHIGTRELRWIFST